MPNIVKETVEKIRDKMYAEKGGKGKAPIGRGGQIRADKIDRDIEAGTRGRQRQGQSTDRQNGY